MINIKFDKKYWKNLEDFELDWRESEQVQQAMQDIAALVETQCTIGELARALPQHQTILLDVLEVMKEKFLIGFEDYKPMPTVIRKLS